LGAVTLSRDGSVVCQSFTFWASSGPSDSSRSEHGLAVSPKLLQRLRVFVAAVLVAAGVSQSAIAASKVVQVLVDQATLVRLDRPLNKLQRAVLQSEINSPGFVTKQPDGYQTNLAYGRSSTGENGRLGTASRRPEIVLIGGIDGNLHEVAGLQAGVAI
jgi:hypothetical protein